MGTQALPAVSAVQGDCERVFVVSQPARCAWNQFLSGHQTPALTATQANQYFGFQHVKVSRHPPYWYAHNWVLTFLSRIDWFVPNRKLTKSLPVLTPDSCQGLRISSNFCLPDFQILAFFNADYIYGLLQERCNSSALTMELRLSCTNPLIYNLAENFAKTGLPCLAFLHASGCLAMEYVEPWWLSTRLQ